MQRVSTTVVTLVGSGAAQRVHELGLGANVLAVVPDDGPPLDRAATVWSHARATSRTYLVHDADPLHQVVARWVAWYDGSGARGELETAVIETTARWRAGAIELPDFYLVLDADALSPTARHWYLGVLHAAAPSRVVPVAADAGAVRRAVTRLPAGRWWPDLPALLDGIDRLVPDRVTEGDVAVADATLVR
jgi:hypothetical protein